MTVEFAPSAATTRSPSTTEPSESVTAAPVSSCATSRTVDPNRIEALMSLASRTLSTWRCAKMRSCPVGSAATTIGRNWESAMVNCSNALPVSDTSRISSISAPGIKSASAPQASSLRLMRYPPVSAAATSCSTTTTSAFPESPCASARPPIPAPHTMILMPQEYQEVDSPLDGSCISGRMTKHLVKVQFCETSARVAGGSSRAGPTVGRSVSRSRRTVFRLRSSDGAILWGIMW